MNKRIIIIGAGGFGREICSILPDMGYSLDRYLDDKVELGFKQIEALNNREFSPDYLQICIGNSKTREAVYKKIKRKYNFPRLIHSSVIIQDRDSVSFGVGTILCAGSIFTCGIKLGNFCVINLNCTIGHDVIMEDFCSLMPSVNIGGSVYLEKGVFIGTGATILPGVRIGANAIIGAGSVVTKNVLAGSVVKGVPAKE